MTDLIAQSIDPEVGLHQLSIRYTAPRLLTANAAVAPVEDFSVLYRMSTGLYGQRGYWRFDAPFPYARPYVSRLHYGSPFDLQVVVPTLLLLGSAPYSLPKLLDLLKGILLLPSDVGRQRRVNKAEAKEARVRERKADALLEEAYLPEETALEKERAERDEATARSLEARAKAIERLRDMDPAVRDAVLERYGPNALEVLEEIAARAERGPVRPESAEITPLKDHDLPEPPKQLPPPSK